MEPSAHLDSLKRAAAAQAVASSSGMFATKSTPQFGDNASASTNPQHSATQQPHAPRQPMHLPANGHRSPMINGNNGGSSGGMIPPLAMASASAASPRMQAFSPAGVVDTPGSMQRNESLSSMASMGSVTSHPSRSGMGLAPPTPTQLSSASPAAAAHLMSPLPPQTPALHHSRSVEPPNRSNLASLFAAQLDHSSMAALLSNAHSAVPPSTAAELLRVGLEMTDAATDEACVDQLDALLRPPTHFAKSAPALSVNRSEFWMAWRRIHAQQRAKAAGKREDDAETKTAAKSKKTEEDDDEDDEEMTAERNEESQRKQADEMERAMQLLLEHEDDMLHSELKHFAFPPAQITAEEENERKEEARAWSLGTHDLFEQRRQQRRALEPAAVRMSNSLLSEAGSVQALQAAVQSRRRPPHDISAFDDASVASTVSPTDTSPSVPSSPSVPLPASIADLLPPQYSLGVHAKYDGVEQRDWESQIQWGDDFTHPQPGAFASLADAAAGVHGPTAYRPPKPVKGEAAPAAKSTAAPTTAEPVSSTFTYLSGVAHKPSSVWNEVPWPTPAPAPVAASPPIPASSPTPSQSTAALPYYPHGGGTVGVAGSHLSAGASAAAAAAVLAAQQQAAANFMAMSFGNNPQYQETMQALNAMGGPAMAAAYAQQTHQAAMMQFLMAQQHGLLPPMPTPAPAPVVAPAPVAPTPPPQPAARVPIKFRVSIAPKLDAPILAQPSRVAHAFAPPPAETRESIERQKVVTAQKRAAKLGKAAANDWLIRKLNEPEAVSPGLESIKSEHEAAWAPARRADKPLPMEAVHLPPLRPASFPVKHMLVPAPVSDPHQPWGTNCLIPPSAAASSIVPFISAPPASKLPNAAFASMDWLDHVVWDDVASNNDPMDAPVRRTLPRSDYTRLIWDVNDPHMLFESAEVMELNARKERERLAKIEADAAALRAEEGEEEKTAVSVNRFNISNDAHYEQDTGFSSHTRIERIRVAHATFASDLEESGVEWYRTAHESVTVQLYPRCWREKIHFVEEDGAISTHRPRLPKLLLNMLKDQGSIKLKMIDNGVSARYAEALNEKLSEGGARQKIVPAKLSELSMTEGGLVLLEYLEQHPLILIKTGMASRIVTYYRRSSDSDEKVIEAADGDVVMLAKNETSSPFLGDVKPGQAVQAIHNNMFIAPMARHVAPAKLAAASGPGARDLFCTFMLVRAPGQKVRWYLRNLPSSYIVGQLEPKKIVPQPDRHYSLDLIRKWIDFTIMKLLYYNEHVQLDYIASLFDPEHKEQIRRSLREFAQIVPRSATVPFETYRAREIISMDKVRQLFTPEDACIYESMMLSQHRLRTLGIRSFTHPKFVTELLDHIKLPHLKRVALYIEKHLQLTPWYLTKGFVQSLVENKGQLQLDGRGNPLADGAGYSYINVRTSGKKKEDELPEELKEVKKKTGTDADLRILTMEQMENALLKFGMTSSEVKSLKRWERVRAIAKFSTEASLEGTHAGMRKFSRHIRLSMQAQQAEFKKAANKIFDKQLGALQSQLRPDYAHELIDDPAALDGSKGGGATTAASKLLKASALSEQREEAEERRQFQEFMSLQQAATATIDTNAVSTSGAAGDRKRKTRKRKRVKHTVLNIQPDGTRVTVVKYIVDKRLVAYHELDLADGGKRLEQALGLISDEEKRAIAGRGGAIVNALNDLSHIYDNAGETTREEGGELSKGGRPPGSGRGRGRGSRGFPRESSDRDPNRPRRPREIGENGEKLPRRPRTGSHHGPGGGGHGRRGHRRAGGDEDGGESDSDSDHGRDDDLSEEDENVYKLAKDHGLDDQYEWTKKPGQDDPRVGEWKVRCGACLNLGHSQGNLHCACQPPEMEPELDEQAYYQELIGGRSAKGPATKRVESLADDGAKTESSGITLNLKSLAAASRGGRGRGGRRSGSTRGAGADAEIDFGLGKAGNKRARAEEQYMATAGKRFRGAAGRRRGDLFKDTIEFVLKLSISTLFRDPVNPALVPDYLQIIKQPMDLRTIRKKATDNEYTNRHEFLADVRLIAENCLLYNGDVTASEGGKWTAFAREIVIIIEQQLKRPINAAKLVEMEVAYEVQTLHGRLEECVNSMRKLPLARQDFDYIPIVAGYAEQIAHPMALNVLQERIKSAAYHSMPEFLYDLELIASNAALFNGPDSMLAKQAAALVAHGKQELSKWFNVSDMVAKKHYIPPPQVQHVKGGAAAASSSSASVVIPSLSGARVPNVRTPALHAGVSGRLGAGTPARRGATPDRRKTTATPARHTPNVHSPALSMLPVTGTQSQRRTAAAASPAQLHIPGSPTAAEDAAINEEAAAAAAAPPSPKGLDLDFNMAPENLQQVLLDAPSQGGAAAAAGGEQLSMPPDAAGGLSMEDDSAFLPGDDELTGQYSMQLDLNEMPAEL